jgi:hypothetical protein
MVLERLERFGGKGLKNNDYLVGCGGTMCLGTNFQVVPRGTVPFHLPPPKGKMWNPRAQPSEFRFDERGVETAPRSAFLKAIKAMPTGPSKKVPSAANDIYTLEILRVVVGAGPFSSRPTWPHVCLSWPPHISYPHAPPHRASLCSQAKCACLGCLGWYGKRGGSADPRLGAVIVLAGEAQLEREGPPIGTQI